MRWWSGYYRTLIALDLTRTSPRQLDEAMRKYGLTGATHKKAVSFFLQAAQYGSVPISPLLKAKTRIGGRGTPAPGGSKLRRRRLTGRRDDQDGPAEVGRDGDTDGVARSVRAERGRPRLRI